MGGRGQTKWSNINGGISILEGQWRRAIAPSLLNEVEDDAAMVSNELFKTIA
jgi:hypothetical protein